MDLDHAVYCVGSQTKSPRISSEKVSSISYIGNVYSSSVVEDSNQHYYRFLPQGASGLMYWKEDHVA